MVVVVALWMAEAIAERQRCCCGDGYSSGSNGVDR